MQRSERRLAKEGAVTLCKQGHALPSPALFVRNEPICPECDVAGKATAREGRHYVVPQPDGRFSLWTNGVGFWGFDFATADAAADAARGVG